MKVYTHCAKIQTTESQVIYKKAKYNLFIFNETTIIDSSSTVIICLQSKWFIHWNISTVMCQSLKAVWRERLMLVPWIPIVWVMLHSEEWGGLSFKHRLVISLHLPQYTFVCTFVSEMRDLLDNRDNCLIHCVCYLPIYSMKIISPMLQS